MLLPTMTLDEIYNAIFADKDFIIRKALECGKDFRRKALKKGSYPYKHKYTFKCYKSNIVYSVYMWCTKRRECDNPLYKITTSYTHDVGTTAIIISFSDEKIYLHTSHFWKRFIERYLEDESYTLDQAIDLYFFNAGAYSYTEGVIRLDNEKYQKDDNIEYYAVANCFGVCYCEKEVGKDNIEVYNTYLPLQMLAKKQNDSVIANYISTYFRDYKFQNPNERDKIDKIFEDVTNLAENEGWSSEKLMDEYPLYMI